MRRLARFVGLLLDFVLPSPDSARLVRESDANALAALVSPTTTETDVVSLLSYRHPLVRAAILESKFHANEKAQRLLAAALSEYAAALTDDYALSGARIQFIPIPLSNARMQERGYNQTERVLKAANLPYELLLKRIRDTVPQTTLPRAARLKNMQNAFAASASIENDVHYVVVDDVSTTGATLLAARQALLDAGAQEVSCLALAH